MRIPCCKMCDPDGSNFNILPKRFPWSREIGENYHILICQNCGKVYHFSLRQYLLLFALHTVMVYLLLIIHIADRFVLPASLVVIMWGTQLGCYCVWNNTSWKVKNNTHYSVTWKVKIPFWAALVLSYPAALLSLFVL